MHHARRGQGRPLRAERRQDVDHQRRHRRRRHRLGQARAASSAGFLVEKGTPGYPRRAARKWSLRASVTSELVLEDVRIPKANILPEDARASRRPLDCLTQARFGIAWGGARRGDGCFETAREYTLSRIQFGKPIASFQLIQNKLAEMLDRDHEGALLVFRRVAPQGRGQARLLARLDVQAEQRPLGARDRAHGARHARRQRHHGRVPDRCAT